MKLQLQLQPLAERICLTVRPRAEPTSNQELKNLHADLRPAFQLQHIDWGQTALLELITICSRERMVRQQKHSCQQHSYST